MLFNFSLHSFGNAFCRSSCNFFFISRNFYDISSVSKKNLNYLWPLIIFFYFLSFLSKQVPFAYTVILQGSLILTLIIKEKSINTFLLIVLSIFVFTLLFFTLLFFLKIDFLLFFTQYIDYPVQDLIDFPK